MGFMSALLFAASAQVGAPSPVEPVQIYRCEAVRDSPAGKHMGSMLVGEAGQTFDAWIRWDQSVANEAGGFNIRWMLDRQLQVMSATVEVEIPMRRLARGRTSLSVGRPDDASPGNMMLTGDVLHGVAGGGRGVAEVGLEALLGYAAGAGRLRWHVVSGGLKKGGRFGDIDMAPIRAAMDAFPAFRNELAARQARYRTECSPYVEQPEI
jgi:hypothetical protein